jgi:hypothetical protein
VATYLQSTVAKTCFLFVKIIDSIVPRAVKWAGPARWANTYKWAGLGQPNCYMGLQILARTQPNCAMQPDGLVQAMFQRKYILACTPKMINNATHNNYYIKQTSYQHLYKIYLQ